MFMISLEEIQQRLAEEIRQSGMTQAEIAKRLGIKHQQISCYLKGQKMPALDTFANLCRILDASSDEILGLKD